MNKKTQIKELKTLLKEEMLNVLNEDVSYNFTFKGKKFKVRFDVNANPTKKGIKIQFFPLENMGLDPQGTRQFMTELQVLLNQKLGAIGMNVDFDPDVPYKNCVGFTLKLGTFATMVINALQKDQSLKTPPQTVGQSKTITR